MIVSLEALNPRKRLAEAFAPNPTDNAWLDCLRALAIALVLLRHGQRVLEMGPTASFIEVIGMNGWAGVDLFFVLSGYLVTAGLLRKYSEKGFVDLSQFAIKRIRRIVPAYFFVLTLVLIGYFPFFVVSGENLETRILYHVFFLQDIFPSDINVVFWSLGVEAKYYTLIPILLLPILRISSLRVILCLGMIAVLMGPAVRWVIYANTHINDYDSFWPALRSPFYACLEPFALGFLVAVLEQFKVVRLNPRTASVLFFFALSVLGLFLSSHILLEDISLWDATAQPLFLAITFSVLIVAAINMKPMRSEFERVFRYGARISYSLYLVHFPLIPLSISLTNALNLGVPAFWMLYTTISIAHALIILAYIEIPFMKTKIPAGPTLPTQHNGQNAVN